MMSTNFIRAKDGKIYLPRPKGWMHGMGLQSLFRKALNEQIHIAAPKYWEELKKDNEMLALVKVAENKYTVQSAGEQND
jgi:hypothetical protein